MQNNACKFLEIDEEFRNFIIRSYENEDNEKLLLFYTNNENDHCLIKENISIPDKAIEKKSPNYLKINVKFLIFIIKECMAKKRGLAMIHNHLQDSMLSPPDLKAEILLLEICKKMQLENFSFLLYDKSKCEIRVRSHLLSVHAHDCLTEYVI